jgi:drug/metabolite transporter (DMT)-like permease
MGLGAVTESGAAGPAPHPPAARTGRAVRGVYSGLLASFFLGWAPVLGKFAYRAHVDPITLAALRTLVAAVFLWCVYALFWRQRILLGWRSLLSCLLVGAVNGVGSLFYYTALERLEASRAALLGALYPVWVVLFLSASGQRIRVGTLLQLIASLVGAILITSPWHDGNPADYLGTMLMLASAAINGWYMVMGQWVLAEVPARSGTLYIITGMALTVSLARVGDPRPLPALIPAAGVYAILALGLTTALSRLAMFFSLEKLGGAETAILNLVELAVSLGLAFLFLGERLAWTQWVGAVLLLGGGLLARYRVEQAEAGGPGFDPMAAAAQR